MTSTGQATSSTDNVHLIIDALADYAKETGFDLSKNPFAAKLEQSNPPEVILQLLQEREKAFKQYRNDIRGLINCLNPAVKILHRFSGILCQAVGQVGRYTGHLVNHLTRSCQIPFPPTTILFAGIDILLGVRALNVLQKSSPIMYKHARLPLRFHRAMTLSWTSSSFWAVSSNVSTSIQRSISLR